MNTAGIRWSPRVRQDKIRRLYETEAQGIADETLIDDVGIALLLRCQSILLRAGNRVKCPACGQVFATGWHWTKREEGKIIRCPGCDRWECTGKQYRESFSGDYLAADNALPCFQEFVDRYPLVTTPRERVLLIDRLIHQFHYALLWDRDKGAFSGNHPDPHAINGCNLIEGSHDEVVAFLDNLTYGPSNEPQLLQTQSEWQSIVARMNRTRRAKK